MPCTTSSAFTKRLKYSPLPPVPLLGCTEIAFAVQFGASLYPQNIHRHKKALYGTCFREAIYWKGEIDALRSPFCGAARSES